MMKGWLKKDGNWYYLGSSGEMVTGTVAIDGQNEVFSSDGVWLYSELQDYDTPLGTEMPLIRVIKAMLQIVQDLLGIR